MFCTRVEIYHNIERYVLVQHIGLVLMLVTSALVGCSGESGPKYVKVTGTVTLDGKPLTAGDVYFFPEASDGQSSYGGIKPDGSYELYCVEQVGAVIGRHRVSVEGPQPISETGAVQPVDPVPEKYSRPDTSEIVKEVTDSENVINLELTSK